MPAWSRTVAFACVVVLVGSGCGGDGGDGDAVRDAETGAADAIRVVEPDLDRLATSVQQADPEVKSTLVEVQAAASRASESLSDARREIRDLESDEDDAAARRVLRDRVSSVRDLQELADVLAQPTLSSPRIEAAFARAKLAIEDLGSDLDVRAIPADVLAASLRKVRDADQRSREQAAARKRARERDSSQTGQPSAPVGSGGSSSASFGYTQYTGPAFQARVPTGPGWGTPSPSEPTPGELFRTNIRGPDGLFVIIDFTPFETAKFGGSYSSRTVVGQTAFGTAVRYEFQGGRIPECQRARCIDYIINDPATGRGFAVLAGGGAAAAEIARTVAESVVPL